MRDETQDNKKSLIDQLERQQITFIDSIFVRILPTQNGKLRSQLSDNKFAWKGSNIFA